MKEEGRGISLPRRESLDGPRLDIVPGEIKLGVVDGHATLGAGRQSGVVDDGDALVRPVGVLEVEHSGPVVGEVLGHLTGGAGTAGADIALHSGVEGISTHDVVEMGRRGLAGLDDGVEALDGQRGAPEA